MSTRKALMRHRVASWVCALPPLNMDNTAKAPASCIYSLGVSIALSPLFLFAAVEVHPRYFRPTEVDLLLGNPAKAKRELGWAPTRNIDDIIAEMITNDMAMMKGGKIERRENKVGL